MRNHARRSLPLAIATISALRDLKPPQQGGAALRRLQLEHQRLLTLYERAAQLPRRRAGALAESIRNAEASVRARAAASRLPACAP